jgi:hypothetical protein
MNPYEPSQLAELQALPAEDVITDSPWPVWRRIFREWEQWRLVYNGVLITIVLIGLVWQGWGGSVLGTMLECLFAGFAANCCYFAGPLLESYVSWLMGRRVSWGGMLFFLGLAFSILVTLIDLLVRYYVINGIL